MQAQMVLGNKKVGPSKPRSDLILRTTWRSSPLPQADLITQAIHRKIFY